MPLAPASGDVYFVDEGVFLEVTDFDFGHGDLREEGGTLMVENC